MNRSLIRAATYVQLFLAIVFATGCAPTQPFFLNEGPDLSHYLDTSTRIEHPDMQASDLEESPQALPPLTLGNHDYDYWDLTLEECVAIALQNSKFLFTVAGTSEERQNVIAQFASGQPGQFGSIYDTALQQTSTQSFPLTIDNNGNRVIARGVQRSNQVGGVEDALAEFDAQYSSVLSYGTTDRPRNVDAATGFNSPLFQAQDGFQQQALSKRLATGGVATFRQQTQYSWNNLPIGAGGVGRDVASDWTAILEAQITHPLMRGRGTMINRIPVVLARLNEDITITEFEALVRNLVYDVERIYWDLYCAYRNVETEVVARNAALATAYRRRSQLQRGSAGTLQDVLRAEGRYYEFRARLQGALAGSNVPGTDPNGVYGLERELRARLGLEATDGRLIRPIDEPTIAPVEFDWYVASEEMALNSPELRRSKIRMKQLELELVNAKNRLLPQVDLSFTGRLVGVGDELGLGGSGNGRFPDPATNQGAVGSEALASLADGNYGELGLRLEVTPTAIGARRELADVNNKKLDLARQKAWIYDQERALQLQLQKALANLQTHYRQIQSFAAWLNAAQDEYQRRLSREERYQESEQIDLVLDAQQSRAQAQIGFYRALCEYNKSLAYVHNLKGTLLAMNSIELKEGPWNEKAYWDALERARERSAGYYYKYGATRPNIVSTGTNKVGTTNVVKPDPHALAPAGIADDVILGLEPVDQPIPYEEGPVGSGLQPGEPSGDSMPELQMPELQIPEAPRGEPVPTPAQESDASLAPAGRGQGGSVQPASFEGTDRSSGIAPAITPRTTISESPQSSPKVSRLPLPRPIKLQGN